MSNHAEEAQRFRAKADEALRLAGTCRCLQARSTYEQIALSYRCLAEQEDLLASWPDVPMPTWPGAAGEPGAVPAGS
jgi:hypothetical protein